MLKNSLRFLVLLLPFFQLSNAQEVPQTEISNGRIRAEIYLPDVEKGYYQGTRFDWSGVMPVLEHDNHSYFGKWFRNYDPKVHESVMGPVEEFNPLGYEEAKIGGSFVKIGVGALRKPKETEYNKFKTYDIQDGGEWKIEKSPDQIIFNHVLDDDFYSYDYKKTISLQADKSEMVITHSLANTSNKTIETEAYNHNFFFIDSLFIGPDYTVRFPFKIVEKGKIVGLGEFAEVKEDEIFFTSELGEDDHVYIGDITGFDKNKGGYKIWVENRRSGAGVKITCDRPLSRLVFWSAQKAICPEPYIDLTITPGAVANWKIKYEFYSF